MSQQTKISIKNEVELSKVLKNIDNNYLTKSKDFKIAIELFTQYCNLYYQKINISKMNEDFFDKFLLYYLPKLKLNFTDSNIKKVLVNVYKLLDHIKSCNNLDLTSFYRKSYIHYADDTVRIINLRKELIKNTDSPIISWNPLIIDYNYYKQNNENKKLFSNREIFEQGYFETIDHIGNYYYLFRKIQMKSIYVKIKLDKNSSVLLKTNDILNFRLKRKMFSTNWQIIEVKECYLSQSNKFLGISSICK